MNFKVVDISMSKSDNLGFKISGNIEKYLTVTDIKVDGKAFKAGLKNGDYILMINGFQIHNRDDILKSLEECQNIANFRVIRKIDVIEEEGTPISINKINKSVIRRRSMQESGSLHREILQHMGSRVSMEISRAYPGTLRPPSRVKYFENAMNQNNREDGISNNLRLSNNPIPDLSNSYQDIQNIPRTMSKVKNLRKSSQSSVKSSNCKSLSESSSVPVKNDRIPVSDIGECKEKPILNLSLRKKSKMGCIFSNNSCSNISYFSKSFQNLPLTTDIDYTPKPAFNDAGSTTSLFDEDFSNSHITEYQINWKAIHCKVSNTTINDIEKEIINYFTNQYTDLKSFPVNSMYRYVTFDGVLNVVFNSILSADNNVDFHEVILSIPAEICDIDYVMESYNIVKLIKCNVIRISAQLREYEERKKDLSSQKENLKEIFNEYLVRPQDSTKMHLQIDRIYKIFHELSNFLIAMVIAMSMWKFSKDFSHLYESVSYQTNILSTSETMLSEFRRSQKNLEKNIINLFRRFKEEGSEKVLELFDKLFSETLELSICIPLLKDKLKRDNEMLGHLENSSTRISHFV